MNETRARHNIQCFYDAVDMPGGYTFNHAETLRTIDLYYMSKFKSGNIDSLGYRKFFYNIVKPAADIATKFIDLDTKDIILVPEHGDDELKVWLMQRKLKQWLKDTDFGCLLNDVAFDLPKYGTVVIKKNKDGWGKVNIQNLRMEPWVKCLDESGFVYEIHAMGRYELDQMGWDADALSQLYARGDETSFTVYSCYDRTSTGWKKTVYGDLYSSTNKDGSVNRAVESEITTHNDFYGALVLYEEMIADEDFPYRELHWEKVPGRWLGYGFIEYLEENQIATNESENLERKGLHFTSLKIYQTRDETIGGSNILTSTQNGDILTTQSEIAPITVEERNLPAFAATRQNWAMNTERKTFTSDITSGANLPSRTPLGVANLQASLATSYFELKRENFGLFIKDLILEDIIPDFKNENRKSHILTFLGSDEEIDKLDEIVSEVKVDEAVVKYAMANGYFPSREVRDVTKQKVMMDLKKNKNRYLEIPDSFYDNARFMVDVLITGENIDNGTKSQVLQLAMQIIGTNPGVVQNPVTKRILFSMLALGGISPVELGLLNEQAATPQAQMPQQGQPQQQVAGSLSAPTGMAGMMGNVQQA